MTKYIMRRVLLMIPIALGVTVVVFSIMHLAPGDPARIMLGVQATPEQVAALRAKLGLDQPIYVQYFRWITGVIKGDWGYSIQTGQPVLEIIQERIGATFKLIGLAMLFSITIGITTGIISAIKQYSIFDYTAMTLALLGISMPSFWLALMLILIFGLHLGWFPISGSGSIKHLILPAISLGWINSAVISRLTRSSMLEVIRQDYITTARAKGLSERAVVYKHALRNALIPVVTIIGLRIPWLFGGAVITETIFAWPGMGRLIVNSVLNRDFPVVQGVVLIMAFIVMFANLAVDILYAFLDPRIRYR